jgi:hypothetical protein
MKSWKLPFCIFLSLFVLAACFEIDPPVSPPVDETIELTINEPRLIESNEEIWVKVSLLKDTDYVVDVVNSATYSGDKINVEVYDKDKDKGIRFDYASLGVAPGGQWGYTVNLPEDADVWIRFLPINENKIVSTVAVYDTSIEHDNTTYEPNVEPLIAYPLQGNVSYSSSLGEGDSIDWYVIEVDELDAVTLKLDITDGNQVNGDCYFNEIDVNQDICAGLADRFNNHDNNTKRFNTLSTGKVFIKIFPTDGIVADYNLDIDVVQEIPE